LERRRRIDQALFTVVMEAYLHGVTTRKIDDPVRALGADAGISKSEVSRICATSMPAADGSPVPRAHERAVAGVGRLQTAGCTASSATAMEPDTVS